MLLKIVRPSEFYELIQSRTSKAIAPAVQGRAWRLAVILSDEETALKKTRFAKSIAEEINAPDKTQNFISLANALVHASNSENYHEFFNDYAVVCKEAHAFAHEQRRVKLLELKRMRKKERLYFYPHVGRNPNMKFFVLLLAGHKRDEGTPTSVANHCESQVSQLLNCTNLKVLE